MAVELEVDAETGRFGAKDIGEQSRCSPLLSPEDRNLQSVGISFQSGDAVANCCKKHGIETVMERYSEQRPLS
jgi:hypothetical protein